MGKNNETNYLHYINLSYGGNDAADVCNCRYR